ncbi:hypothetical protein RUM43_002943 [Polyplax serrata]|uniref:Uncharacterized protein n=1 Tax=Polyplax serrata TaxID=468196 RepID=A0AAN8PGS6_POLSC
MQPKEEQQQQQQLDRNIQMRKRWIDVQSPLLSRKWKENEFSRVDTSIAKSSLKSENKRFVLLLYFSTDLKLRLRPVKKVRKEVSRRQRERGRWVRGENQGGFAVMPERVVGVGQVMKTKNNAMD